MLQQRAILWHFPEINDVSRMKRRNNRWCRLADQLFRDPSSGSVRNRIMSVNNINLVMPADLPRFARPKAAYDPGS